MATIFSLTITIGKGDAARTREISIDPDEVPMGVLEDLESLGASKEWKQIRPIICELFGLSNEEFRAITSKQFIAIAAALNGAVGAAVTIPNDAS
jgi:hypothetical protein